MIHLITDAPELFSDISEVVRLFLGNVEISLTGGDDPLTHRHEKQDDLWIEHWSWRGESIAHTVNAEYGGLKEKRAYKRAVKTGCFLLFRRVTGQNPPWGSLTGIRPTRLLYEAMERGLSLDEGVHWLEDSFYVSPERAYLLREIIEAQRGLIEHDEDEFDLYIGIPFCTTRCAYCSFSSGEIGDGQLVAPYVNALLKEIELCAGFLREKKLRLRAGYIGGGTPTSIPAPMLSRILDAAKRAFPGAREWTVEAGRPDTIDRETLSMLKEHDVNRISVNPQSFSDETLKLIGRAHTAEDTQRAYALAREMGFQDINMDIICALPGEDERDFQRTLNRVLALGPDSVTVHTLAIKRSSKLHEALYRQAEAEAAENMVQAARHALTENGYKPYYLYRQKYMTGNLENAGYAKENKACLYNIDNMEETAPVLALGAGAITKWLFPRERRIERAPNVKNIDQYIARVNEMAERKRALILGKENEA